jgi:Cu-Zn family superoxide dismutase
VLRLESGAHVFQPLCELEADHACLPLRHIACLLMTGLLRQKGAAMSRRNARITVAVSFGMLCLMSCGQQPEDVPEGELERMTEAPDSSVAATDRMEYAAAELLPTMGNEARGSVTFTVTEGIEGVHIEAQMTGLLPGQHGFHIHEIGDCSAPDGSSAGEHFAPDNTPHGSPDDPPAERHAGDLGNIEAGANREAVFMRHDGLVSLLHGPPSILGKAIVVHEGPDDFETQPSGNAGSPIACGVIEAVKPPTAP